MQDIEFNYSKVSEKFFVKHENIREAFKRSVIKLIQNENPEQINFKNLKGKLKGYSRIAIAEYRIIYKIINNEIIIVSVVLAGSRGDIYKHMNK